MAIETAWTKGMLSPSIVRQILTNRSAPPTPPPVKVPAELAKSGVLPAGINCYDKLLEVNV